MSPRFCECMSTSGESVLQRTRPYSNNKKQQKQTNNLITVRGCVERTMIKTTKANPPTIFKQYLFEG